MQADDIDAVLVTEGRSTAHPWTRKLFEDSLHAGYSAWVVRQTDQHIGHAVVLSVLDEAHLLLITIHPSWQGQGYGTQLLEYLSEQARFSGATQMFLEVRSSNRVAQAMYLNHGFAEIGRRRAYYPDADGLREDALVMRRAL